MFVVFVQLNYFLLPFCCALDVDVRRMLVLGGKVKNLGPQAFVILQKDEADH
jgi:hypothetical protein